MVVGARDDARGEQAQLAADVEGDPRVAPPQDLGRGGGLVEAPEEVRAARLHQSGLDPHSQAVLQRDRRRGHKPIEVGAVDGDGVAVQLVPDGADLPAHLLLE